MGVTEKEFEDELETFRVSIDTAAQFFYAFQAIHFITSRDKAVLDMLNWYSMFWNTNINALREAAFIALGRVFDQDSRTRPTHNLGRLLRVAQDSPDIFKASAPRWCKQLDTSEPPHYVYEPQPEDWRVIRKQVSKWRKVYEANYDSIRNKVYAHQERISPDEETELFKQTSYAELEKLFAFLDALYNALWELYNGHKPVIHDQQYSLEQMLTSEIAGQRGQIVGELVARQAKSFLEEHTSCIAQSTMAILSLRKEKNPNDS